MASATNKSKQRQSSHNKSYFETHARALDAKKARRKVVRAKKVAAFLIALGPIRGPKSLSSRSKRRDKRPLTAAGEARRDRRIAKGLAARNQTVNEQDIGRN